MLEIWARMYEALYPHARLILADLGHYAERDLKIPGPEQDGELTPEEQEELRPIVRALMEAAVVSEVMPPRIQIATLIKVIESPSLFFSCELPAAVQWEIANDYQRGDEKPGMFSIDVWGDEQTRCSSPLVPPTESSIKNAAEAARCRVALAQSPGRPPNLANRVVAEQLSKIFRSSGHPIVRHRESARMFDGKVVYVETGPFYDFLELVLSPLQRYLSERRLAPVTIDSVVRIVTEEFS
jgi:hypothetical protein